MVIAAVIVLAAGVLLIVLFRPVAEASWTEPDAADVASPPREPADVPPDPVSAATVTENGRRRHGTRPAQRRARVAGVRTALQRSTAPVEDTTEQPREPSRLADRIAAHIRLQHPRDNRPL